MAQPLFGQAAIQHRIRIEGSGSTYNHFRERWESSSSSWQVSATGVWSPIYYGPNAPAGYARLHCGTCGAVFDMYGIAPDQRDEVLRNRRTKVSAALRKVLKVLAFVLVPVALAVITLGAILGGLEGAKIAGGDLLCLAVLGAVVGGSILFIPVILGIFYVTSYPSYTLSRISGAEVPGVDHTVARRQLLQDRPK